MMSGTATTQHYDVVIMGGGLAGLTLSLQLRQRFADLSILVIERRAHPVPLAAHKVGESSVEIAAHYFDSVLGLKSHLESEQIRKFGFRFFFSEGRRDFDQVTELGGSTVFPTQSYQIDRGIFENRLAEMAQAAGVTFVDAAMIRRFDIGEKDTSHQVTYEAHGQTISVTGRWLIDSSGRAGLIKRKLDLAQDNAHKAGAVWFRIGKHINMHDWSQDQDWINACNPPDRWRSTSHLVGEGYWVWLIPLSSGSHSVGIVADPAVHPVEKMNTFDKAMDWLQRYQPRLFEHLDGERDKLQDFAFFKHFSYGCKQMYCGERRWALTGEAGLFLDPFYSPGGDFIAIGNTNITELIAHDRANGPVVMVADYFQKIYFSLYESMLPVYQDQYRLFGDPEVLPHKVTWDYAYYWGVMCQLFFQNRLTDLITMARLQKRLAHMMQVNAAVQAFFRAWSQHSARRNPAQLLDQTSIDWFAELNRGLNDQLDDAQFMQRMDDNLVLLQHLAAAFITRACDEHPALADSQACEDLRALLDEAILSALPVMGAPTLFTNAAYARAG
ncbi:halogenase [Oxalicibacterium faecigallinarum]|uniref:Halogenase n=2 Tax=Oxalicibacterium faecigallinarum TaxID=573741 RepID=A0A8J3F3X6_9BURK|nr:halogenase [Oxalicibacterium faecigallinarum]